MRVLVRESNESTIVLRIGFAPLGPFIDIFDDVNKNGRVSEHMMSFVSAANDTLGSKVLWISHDFPRSIS